MINTYLEVTPLLIRSRFYTYQDQSRLGKLDGDVEAAGASMREFMHIVPPGFRQPAGNQLCCLVAKVRAAENVRCSWLGNGFHTGIVA